MTFITDMTKTISNSTICDWYFYLYLINAAVFVIFFLSIITSLIFSSKVRNMFGLTFTIQVISMAISLVSSLFFYLMCDRALLKNE